MKKKDRLSRSGIRLVMISNPVYLYEAIRWRFRRGLSLGNLFHE